MGRLSTSRVRNDTPSAGVGRDPPPPWRPLKMYLPRAFRLTLVGMIAATLPIGAALAQSPAPAASPTATPAPAASPAPAPSPTPEASPAPSPSASPTPSASPSPAPSAPPAAAQTPATPPAAAVQTADPFGEPVTLEAKKVVTIKGNANWDSAFETLMESFKTLNALLEKQGIKPTGNPLI